MRVAVYYSNKDVRIEERPVPKIGPRELLVRVHSSGICGSDVMEWYRLEKAPLVLGHEIAGEIAETGDEVTAFRSGDRVSVSHHVPCNTCRYCLAGEHSLCDTLRSTNFDPGGFSEYIRVPEINVDRGTFLLPDEISYDAGAFIEPLACVLRGLSRASGRPGRSALVLGSGISGVLYIKALRALGAGRIVATDIVDSKLEAARRFGADEAVLASEATVERLRELGGGRLFDLVVTCAGTMSVTELALRCSDRGGTIILFAPLEPGIKVDIPLFDVWRDQVRIVSTYAGCPADIESAVELLRSGRITVEDMISHRLPLERTADGFKLTADGADSLKVIIRPQE